MGGKGDQSGIDRITHRVSMMMLHDIKGALKCMHVLLLFFSQYIYFSVYL